MKTQKEQPAHTKGDKMKWFLLTEKGQEVPAFEHNKGYWIKYVVTSEGYVLKIEGTTKEEAEANAKRIVKAVNMHDELIEAVKWALNTCKEIQSKKSSALKFPETASLGGHLQELLKQAEQK